MPTMVKKSKSVFKAFLDVLFPPVCYVCGKVCSSKYGLCGECLEKIKHIPPPHCPKCGRRLFGREKTCRECDPKDTSLEKSWSCCYYEDTVKDCIHLFKYSGYVGLSDVFRDIMINFAKKNKINSDIDIVVPVPAFGVKKRERSYNHAEVLANSLSENFNIPCDSKNLRKIKWTQSQSELDKTKRTKNLKDSFLVVDKEIFKGKNVLLVDDVYTTGATIKECAKALRDAKAGKIYSFTLARGA